MADVERTHTSNAQSPRMEDLSDSEFEKGLLQHEDEQQQPLLSYGRSREQAQGKLSTIAQLLLFGGVIAIPITIFAVFLLQATKYIAEPAVFACGNSSAEARTLGCTYDIMMDSWLPPACYDEDLSREFQKLQDWPMYYDKNATRRMTVEELSERGQMFVHTTIEYHFVHCLFALRKLHRAMEFGFLIEREVAELGHTDHCANFVAGTERRLEDPNDLPSLKKIGTKLPVAFPTCISASSMVKTRYKQERMYR